MKTLKAFNIFFIFIFLKTFCFSQRVDNVQLVFDKYNYKFDKNKIEKFKEANRNLELSVDINSPHSLYAHGIGLINSAENHADTINAIKLIDQSAKLNYSPALYKMGVYYKYGIGVIKDLDISFTLFDLAARKEDINGLYSRGYMYYKGLGCDQNYSKAFLDFEKCATKGNPTCMYMLGLCYRNGFGTQINESKALKWLELSMINGNTSALLEMSYVLPEINEDILDKIKSCNEINIIKESNNFRQNEFNRLQNTIPHKFKNNLFEGYMVKYDYSGNIIVKIEKFEVASDIFNDVLTLKFENETNGIYIEGILKNSVLNVNSEGVLRNDRYILNTNDKWILNSIRFDEHVSSSQNFLVGNIWSYSTYEQEDERPSKIFLFEKKTDTLSPLPIIDKVNLQASPNPFIDELIIRFDLNKKSICRLTLSDISGKLYFNSNQQNLESGSYVFPLNLQLIPGLYFITLQSDNNFHHLKTIKI